MTAKIREPAAAHDAAAAQPPPESDLDLLDETVASRAGLHRTDLLCLEIVAREGPLSAGRLAAMAGFSTSAMTCVIDRLEQAGRMRRAPDMADRRRVLLEVTAVARQDGQTAFAGLVKVTDQLLARYSASELHLIDQFLDAIRAVLIDQAAAQSPSDSAAGPDARDSAGTPGRFSASTADRQSGDPGGL